MIWSLYAMLGTNMWYHENDRVLFDDEAWDKIVTAAAENGINQIVLDLGEGVRYASHPELAKPGAWTRQRVRREVKRLRALGIELIPKMNFSACHHLWLGEYRWMMSTKKYYEVCRDLITEVYSLFESPRYIHIGMDEEGDPQFFKMMELVAYRQGELYWHDLQFLLDCVRDTGATPWIWADSCMYKPEEFRAHISTEDIVLQPWIYYSIKKEHYTKTEGKETYINIGKEYGIDFVEEAPIWQIFTRESMIAANDGYKLVPCASLYFENEWCHDDLPDYYKSGAPKDSILGYMTAPWLRTQNENVDAIIAGIKALAAAREKYYGEI